MESGLPPRDPSTVAEERAAGASQNEERKAVWRNAESTAGVASWRLLWLILAVLLMASAASGGQSNWDPDDPVSTVRVEAVVGRSAALPCDIEPLTREDRVYMVLWFREAAGKPLYSASRRLFCFASLPPCYSLGEIDSRLSSRRESLMSGLTSRRACPLASQSQAATRAYASQIQFCFNSILPHFKR
ncbi:uncharacterized protein LOC124168380 [Ischnura elegans]|uniref:uncharacterized protein LOC124168380 n=1 Tax=Ischnura elegans TaxID=197161 RepID=UPI001ED8B568|nr:uncharacterized protein LOC124168380 [Ischnura elegans]